MKSFTNIMKSSTDVHLSATVQFIYNFIFPCVAPAGIPLRVCVEHVAWNILRLMSYHAWNSWNSHGYSTRIIIMGIPHVEYPRMKYVVSHV